MKWLYDDSAGSPFTLDLAVPVIPTLFNGLNGVFFFFWHFLLSGAGLPVSQSVRKNPQPAGEYLPDAGFSE